MNCPRCQHDAPTDAEFCPACGTRFVTVCAQCGSENASTNNFCKKCGDPLAMTPVTAPGPPRLMPRPAAEAERRQLTVMFCDLVGATSLSERLDPEDLRDLVGAYQAACAEVITRFEGHVAQYLGDGLLVYFGYPMAHEDDSERAVRTALGILNALRSLNAKLEPNTGVRLEVRLGIHTGLVVVGEIGVAHERLALGETPNVAARLQGLAEPGTVVISAATHRLVRELFLCRDLGLQVLKGISAPVQAHQVLGEAPNHGPLEAAAPTGVTPLIGREQEVGLLLERWEQVTDGLGQVVVLSGEPGIGKSRLVRVVKERLADRPHTQLECRCSPYHQNSPLYPVIDLLLRMLGAQRGDSARETLARLDAALASYGVSPPETALLLASLLSLPHPERYPPLAMTPERQKQKTLEAVLAVVLAMAARHPVLLIVEDLHWVDASTLELLGLLLDQVPTARLFVLLTARPEFRPQWATRSHLTQITLNRFTRKQTEVMVGRVAGGRALPAEVLQQVIAKTDGVPLFVEELTKLVLESGLLRQAGDRYELTGPVPPLAIPATLQDSLTARLDRLATVKQVAQLGATLARTFSYEVLRAVAQFPEAQLQQALTRLVDAELLYQRGLPPQATYTFKHALIQEAAYQSLLRSTRQQYHQRIARVLAERFPETAETQPELLAYHLTKAGLADQAVPHWERAGERAIERSAHLEAIGHLTMGLEVLAALPDTDQRARQELALNIMLGPALMNTKGFEAPDVERVYVRARELCRQAGDTRQLFQALWGLYYLHQVRGQLELARETGEELLALAVQLRDPVLFVVAHRAQGNSLFWRGELGLAHAHVTQALALYDHHQTRDHAVRYGQDSGVLCRLFGAVNLWLLGYPDQARQWSEAALAHAQRLLHTYTLAQALCFSALLHLLRREATVAQERAEAQRELCTEHGFAPYLAWGTIQWGSALVAQGEWAEGLTQMRKGLAAYRVTGRLPRLLFLGLLAEACGRAGQIEEGLLALHEALEAMQTTEERMYEAEVHRLRGELLLQHSAAQQGEAEESFHQALTVARRQQAKSLELRAAMSMTRLWQRQGKRDAAQQLLAQVYGWFTEGFDTADLNEARALLEAASS